MSHKKGSASDEPSKEAKEKAEHLKRSIEKIKGQRLKYSRDRRKRAAELEMKLQNEDQPQDTKRGIQIQHFLDESHSLRTQRAAKQKIKASDFKIIKIIGKGAFGEVRIVRHKDNAKVFAMKTMLKKMMIAKNQLGHIVAERDLMSDADNPWLVQLYYAFQDASYLYLVMEYCGGGDLMGLLIKKDILSESHTRFYMSELAAAINYVHELGYVHRDLKPDNVLISNKGHIRLSDFGLAKSFQSSNDSQLDNWQQFVATLKASDIQKMKEDDKKIGGGSHDRRKKDGKRDKVDRKKLYSTVGTPDYIAIEVLYQKGYDKKVDWWSMGVIMFECLVGYAPFHANDPLATCRKIVRYERYFKIPADIKLTKQSVDLMKALVCPAHRRIGWGKIKGHPWFKKVRWDNLKGHKPPFVPALENEIDAQYFDDIEEEQDIEDVDANVKQSGYSTAADEQNRVWGYTFNRNDAQGFKDYAAKANQALANVNANKAANGNKPSSKSSKSSKRSKQSGD
eukprot:569346_1